MIRKILSLFFILMTVWAGLGFAQTVGKTFYLVDGLFNVSGMPVTMLVDKKGVIRHIEEGTGGAKLLYMQDKLQELVRE